MEKLEALIAWSFPKSIKITCFTYWVGYRWFKQNRHRTWDVPSKTIWMDLFYRGV